MVALPSTTVSVGICQATQRLVCERGACCVSFRQHERLETGGGAEDGGPPSSPSHPSPCSLIDVLQQLRRARGALPRPGTSPLPHALRPQPRPDRRAQPIPWPLRSAVWGRDGCGAIAIMRRWGLGRRGASLRGSRRRLAWPPGDTVTLAEVEQEDSGWCGARLERVLRPPSPRVPRR